MALTYSEFVDQQYRIEPLAGPVHPSNYTKRFPDELYHKAPESHLMRFLYTLLGPAGVGWLRKQTYENRLVAEQVGLELFDLDTFYSDPFRFGRITDELYTEDPLGILTREEWDSIRVKDAAYRSRAIDFMNGARAGNTPLGMRLVARSGLGHEVEIIENYKYVFDSNSDDPIGLDHYGKSLFLNEFVVLPRQESPRNEEQVIHISGNPTGGNFVLKYNGLFTSTISWDADLFEVENALQALPTIGTNNVQVRGGPAPNNDFTVRFVNQLSYRDVPELEIVTSLTGGSNVEANVTTIITGHDDADEIVHISARNQHSLQEALDRIRPVTTIPTIGEAPGRRQRQNWSTAFASSEYNEAVRYVTGNPAILYPPVDKTHWIERNVEKEAPKAAGDLQYHYTGFHAVASVSAYGEDDLPSEHLGRFNAAQQSIPGYSYLRGTDDTLTYKADRILADYAEPLTVTSQAKGTNLINGIYPSDYLESPSVPTIKYADEQFWASKERREGVEYVELDFGTPQAVNFLAMEIAHKPLNVAIFYDVLDQSPRRRFLEVSPVGSFPSTITYEGGRNPWATAEFHFEDALGRVPFTRFILIKFEREQDALNPFLIDPSAKETIQLSSPWSVDVRNLRVGRNVSDF